MKRNYRKSSNIQEQGRPENRKAKEPFQEVGPYEPALIKPISQADRQLVSPSMERLRRVKMDRNMSAKPDPETERAMERAARTNPIRKMSRNPFKAVK